MAESEPSYIDYDTFLAPEFNAASFANTLVTSTNNINDTQLDLSTPLSRVLFDLQEIDTHIHNLTTKSALPLLAYTQDQTQASQRILTEVEEQVSSLSEGYARLEKEVGQKWANAEEARIASENSWATLRLARAVGRCISLGRQLEGQMAEVTGRSSGKDDHRAMVRAANTILLLRQMFAATGEGEEAQGLDRVKVIRTLRSDLFIPSENTTKARAQQVINRFSISSLPSASSGTSGAQSPPPAASTYAQTEEVKSRLSSAITTLYLLSPIPKPGITAATFEPELLISTLQGYIHNTLTASLSSFARGLSTPPSLDGALNEVTNRCQDLAAVEFILAGLKRPTHPLLPSSTNRNNETGDSDGDKSKSNLLQPLLHALDTSSLPSYYWRSLASSLPARIQEDIKRSRNSRLAARTLLSNRDRLRTDLRNCVFLGSQLPSSLGKARNGAASMMGNWEREATVMVSSVINALGQ